MLERRGVATAALDARLLTGHVLGFDALALATREREPAPPGAAEALATTMQRRLAGESVARILGAREFYGLDFALGPATLEPRPDTELLVDLALRMLPPGGRLLDLGTGTGCVAIAVLAHRGDASGLATDLEEAALAVARGNARRHGVDDRLDFAQGSWFEALSGPERFDLILSNPPYIASAVIATLAAEVRDFDPPLALDGGADGLGPYRVIAADSARHLRQGGKVLVEIGHDQGETVPALFAARGFADIVVHKDLAGLDRVVLAHQIGAMNADP